MPVKITGQNVREVNNSAPTTNIPGSEVEVVELPNGSQVHVLLNQEKPDALGPVDFGKELGKIAAHGTTQLVTGAVDIPWYIAQFIGKKLGLKTEEDYHSVAEEARNFLNEYVVPESNIRGARATENILGAVGGGGAIGAGLALAGKGAKAIKYVNNIPGVKPVSNFLGADDIPLNTVAGAIGSGASQAAAENDYGTLGQINAGLGGSIGSAAAITIGRGKARSNLENIRAARERLGLIPDPTLTPAPLKENTQKAKELIELGNKHGIPILRSDLTDSKSPVHKLLLSSASKNIGGTGSMRLNQQKARKNAVDDIMNDYGVNENSVKDSVKMITEQRKALTNKYLGERQAVVDTVIGAKPAGRLLKFKDGSRIDVMGVNTPRTLDFIEKDVGNYTDISPEVYGKPINELNKVRNALEVERPVTSHYLDELDKFHDDVYAKLMAGEITQDTYDKLFVNSELNELISKSILEDEKVWDKAARAWNNFVESPDTVPEFSTISEADMAVIKSLLPKRPDNVGGPNKVPKLDFGQLLKLRTTIGRNVPENFGQTKDDYQKSLEGVYGKVTEDIEDHLSPEYMEEFINNIRPDLKGTQYEAELKDILNRWKAVNEKISGQLKETDKTAFRNAIDEGEADNKKFLNALMSTDSDVLNSIKKNIPTIKEGDPRTVGPNSTLRVGDTDPDELKKIQAIIIDDIFSKTDTSPTGNIIVNARGGIADKMKARKLQLETFFSKDEIKALEGFKRLLNVTKEAQESTNVANTGAQLLGPFGLGTVGMGSAGLTAIASSGDIGKTLAVTSGALFLRSAPALLTNLSERPRVTELLVKAATANNKELASIRGLLSKYLVKNPTVVYNVTTEPEKKGKPR